MGIVNMKEIYGNIIDLAEIGKFDVIIHGANCFCTFGAGIAKEIKQRYPQAYDADLKTRKGDVSKLGTYSSVVVTSKKKNSIVFTIVNAYTQYHYGRIGIRVNYKAIEQVMRKIKTDFPGKKIGYPLIGTGLAGGNWSFIEKIINTELESENHILVKLQK